MMVKMVTQLAACSRSKNIKLPNTTKIASMGIMALMPSAAPRLELSVLSVSHALKQASLAVEPKKVITQSMMMVRLMQTVLTATPAETIGLITSVRMRAKLRMEIPHKRYPTQIKTLRLPTRSLSAPIKMVVRVATTAEAETIRPICAAVAWNIL